MNDKNTNIGVQKEILQMLDEVLSLRNTSKEQKREVYDNLESAITANLIGRLLDELGEEKRQELDQKKAETPEEFLKSLFEHFSPEDLREHLGRSFEVVVDGFLNRV